MYTRLVKLGIVIVLLSAVASCGEPFDSCIQTSQRFRVEFSKPVMRTELQATFQELAKRLDYPVYRGFGFREEELANLVIKRDIRGPAEPEISHSWIRIVLHRWFYGFDLFAKKRDMGFEVYWQHNAELIQRMTYYYQIPGCKAPTATQADEISRVGMAVRKTFPDARFDVEMRGDYLH